jgi:hypothetical protein
MYDDDHDGKSSLTKVVVMALISATSVISLISFSFDAEAQTFGDNNNNNNNPNSALLTELFTNDKQSADTVNIGATTTDPSNTITNVVTSLITRGSYMNPYIDIKGGGGLDTTLESVEAVIGSPETRGFLLTDTTTAQSPAAKAGIQGGDLLAADIRGSYTEISRIINIPKDIPNSSSSSSSIVPNSSNLTNAILTYQNNSYGIRIQYPANWTKSEQELDPNDNVTNIVALSSPLLSTFDNFSETLAISTETLSNQNMTLKEYATSLVTDYNKTLTDFKLIDLNTKIVLGGKPAYGLTYTDREDNINYKTAEIGTIIGDRIYYVEYIAEEKQYSDYLPKIKMMIDSLQIT